MELKEWWDVEYKIYPISSLKYDKKLDITIKNHSPYNRNFKIMFKGTNIKDQINALRLRMYLDIIAPIVIPVDKYSKKVVSINIPRLATKEEDPYIDISIVNESTKEEKIIRIYL